MLFLEVPPFDVLTGQQAPYSGFGEADIVVSELPSAYVQTVHLAMERLNEVFDIPCSAGAEAIVRTDETIARMWEEGWNPQEGQVNLFATDFGCVVAESMREPLSGMLVFRSLVDLSHLSLWWPKKGIEAFPFHATYKRLCAKDGNSLLFFVQRVRSLTLS